MTGAGRQSHEDVLSKPLPGGNPLSMCGGVAVAPRWGDYTMITPFIGKSSLKAEILTIGTVAYAVRGHVTKQPLGQSVRSFIVGRTAPMRPARVLNPPGNLPPAIALSPHEYSPTEIPTTLTR